MARYGIRITHSRAGTTREATHTYRVSMGKFKNPNIVHPAIEEYLGDRKRSNGRIEFAIDVPDRSVNTSFYPFGDYYEEEFRKKLARNGVGSLVEYVVLNHLARNASAHTHLTHATNFPARRIQLEKTGRPADGKSRYVSEEVAALKKYLEGKGLMQHVRREAIDAHPRRK